MKSRNRPETIAEAMLMSKLGIADTMSILRQSDSETRRLVSSGDRGAQSGPARSGFGVALTWFTCLFIAWFLFAADFADAAPYKGKTKGGSSITFGLKGKRVTGINTVVPTICLQTGGSYDSSAGSETYRPRRAAIGRTVKSKALQPAAMHFGVDVTKYYEVNLKRKGKVVSGKLRLSYSYFVPDLWNPRTYVCQGGTSFTARPR